MRPDQRSAEFDIDLIPIWPADDPRLEPILIAAPPPPELDGSAEIEAEPDDGPGPPAPPAAADRARAIGPLGSLGVHLLPLLLLLGWRSAPAEIPAAIPVQLVLEQPPETAMTGLAPPSTAPAPVADTLAERPSVAPASATAGSARAAAPRKPAAAAPAPVRAAVPPYPVSPAKPTLPPTAHAATLSASATPDRPAAEAGETGPDLARSDYLARLVVLTRQHLDLLPASQINGRSGETVLAILVLEDGTIAHIAVARSSGYPDIDSRVEQMVAAVRRFPPLPGWFRQPSLELNLRLRFPFPEP